MRITAFIICLFLIAFFKINAFAQVDASLFTKEAWKKYCYFPVVDKLTGEDFVCDCMYKGILRDFKPEEISEFLGMSRDEYLEYLDENYDLRYIETGCLGLERNFESRPNRYLEIEKVLVEEGVYLADLTEEGVYYIILEAGSGENPLPGDGNQVKINWEGSFLDGEVFAKSNPENPEVYKLGASQLIKGFDLGLRQFSSGTKGVLIIPPSLGYGSNGQPPLIPGNTVLVFLIEVLDVW